MSTEQPDLAAIAPPSRAAVRKAARCRPCRSSGIATTALSDTRVVAMPSASFAVMSSPANQKLTDEKSPAGKTDCHTMGACYEVLNVLKK